MSSTAPPSGKEQNMSDTAAELVRNLLIHHSDGTTVEGNMVTLSKADTLHFRLEFDPTMADRRFRVTVVICHRGKTATTPVLKNEFRHTRVATTFTWPMVDVQGTPPWLEFDVVDTTPPDFHAGPGPYETTIALTPTDEASKPDEENTSSLSYDFTGI
jgi:hypothetical protein